MDVPEDVQPRPHLEHAVEQTAGDGGVGPDGTSSEGASGPASIAADEAAELSKEQREIAQVACTAKDQGAGDAGQLGADSPTAEPEEEFDPEVPGFSLPTSHTVKTVYTPAGRYSPPPLPELED